MDNLRQATVAFLAHRHELMAFSLGLTRDPHVAEDILQETWLHLERHIANGGSITNVAAYCAVIARNAIVRHWRDTGRERPLDAQIVDLLVTGFTHEPSGWPDRLAALRRCLGALSVANRALMDQRYVEGRSNQDIADRLRVSLDALAMRLMRVRQGLKRCVAQRLAQAEAE
jgi:RNA polymerase sigma-70 factor (ECF subfamily)